MNQNVTISKREFSLLLLPDATYWMVGSYEELKQAIPTRRVVIDVGIRTATKGHLTVLLFDPSTKSVLFYDPLSFTHPQLDVLKMNMLSCLLCDLCEPGWTLILQPQMLHQGIHHIRGITEDNFCSLYCLSMTHRFLTWEGAMDWNEFTKKSMQPTAWEKHHDILVHDGIFSNVLHVQSFFKRSFPEWYEATILRQVPINPSDLSRINMAPFLLPTDELHDMIQQLAEVPEVGTFLIRMLFQADITASKRHPFFSHLMEPVDTFSMFPIAVYGQNVIDISMPKRILMMIQLFYLPEAAVLYDGTRTLVYRPNPKLMIPAFRTIDFSVPDSAKALWNKYCTVMRALKDLLIPNAFLYHKQTLALWFQEGYDVLRFVEPLKTWVRDHQRKEWYGSDSLRRLVSYVWYDHVRRHWNVPKQAVFVHGVGDHPANSETDEPATQSVELALSNALKHMDLIAHTLVTMKRP
jgi:hypothetical protein